jgi:hypothetical protein
VRVHLTLTIAAALALVPGAAAQDRPITARIARRVTLGGPTFLPEREILDVRWSPDGSVLAVVCSESTALVDPIGGDVVAWWPALHWRRQPIDPELWHRRGVRSVPRSLDFSPDGRRLVVTTGKQLERWTRGATGPDVVVASEVDAVVYVGSDQLASIEGQEVRLRDARTLAVMRTLRRVATTGSRSSAPGTGAISASSGARLS